MTARKQERPLRVFDLQRMWDLIRYKRMDLHTDGLITNEEYSERAQDHAAVKRLESYDELRQQLSASRDEVKQLQTALELQKATIARLHKERGTIGPINESRVLRITEDCESSSFTCPQPAAASDAPARTQCLGYPECDGDLAGEPHEPDCPAFKGGYVPCRDTTRQHSLNMDRILEEMKTEPIPPIQDILVGCANLLDTIRGEWGQAWSEWDQSIRDGITKHLLSQPASDALAPTKARERCRWEKDDEEAERCYLPAYHYGPHKYLGDVINQPEPEVIVQPNGTCIPIAAAPHSLEELGPCPLCNGPAYDTKTVNGSSEWIIGCSTCGIHLKAALVPGPAPNQTQWSKDIRSTWNRRTFVAAETARARLEVANRIIPHFNTGNGLCERSTNCSECAPVRDYLDELERQAGGSQS